MRRRTFLLGLAELLSSLVAVSSRLGFAYARHANELHLVRTICIGKVEGLRRDDHFLAELRAVLATKNFTVAKDVENADAVLAGVIEIVIVLDGDGTNIPDDTLRFHLTSPSTNVQIWSSKIKVPAQSTSEKDDKYKAQRLAAKIWRDWSESAKRAAKKSRSGATSH